MSRLAGVGLSVIVFMSTTGGEAFGVVGGKTVSITAAPWTVVVREAYEPGRSYAACTGVIIDPRHVLTAGHCVMQGNSAKPLPSSAFRIEAGVSNYKHLLKSDHPHFREVSVVRVMPGYIAASRWTNGNVAATAGHDLAVLTLSRPLDLDGDLARAAYLPSASTREPGPSTRLLIAGFGDERPSGYENGTLNEVVKSRVSTSCTTSQVVCVYSRVADTCLGDSGSGLVEPGAHPTVVGILSDDLGVCLPTGIEFYASLTAPAALRFIKTST